MSQARRRLGLFGMTERQQQSIDAAQDMPPIEGMGGGDDEISDSVDSSRDDNLNGVEALLSGTNVGTASGDEHSESEVAPVQSTFKPIGYEDENQQKQLVLLVCSVVGLFLGIYFCFKQEFSMLALCRLFLVWYPCWRHVILRLDTSSGGGDSEADVARHLRVGLVWFLAIGIYELGLHLGSLVRPVLQLWILLSCLPLPPIIFEEYQWTPFGLVSREIAIPIEWNNRHSILRNAVSDIRQLWKLRSQLVSELASALLSLSVTFRSLIWRPLKAFLKAFIKRSIKAIEALIKALTKALINVFLKAFHKASHKIINIPVQEIVRSYTPSSYRLLQLAWQSELRLENIIWYLIIIGWPFLALSVRICSELAYLPYCLYHRLEGKRRHVSWTEAGLGLLDWIGQSWSQLNKRAFTWLFIAFTSRLLGLTSSINKQMVAWVPLIACDFEYVCWLTACQDHNVGHLYLDILIGSLLTLVDHCRFELNLRSKPGPCPIPTVFDPLAPHCLRCLDELSKPDSPSKPPFSNPLDAWRLFWSAINCWRYNFRLPGQARRERFLASLEGRLKHRLRSYCVDHDVQSDPHAKRWIAEAVRTVPFEEGEDVALAILTERLSKKLHDDPARSHLRTPVRMQEKQAEQDRVRASQPVEVESQTKPEELRCPPAQSATPGPVLQDQRRTVRFERPLCEPTDTNASRRSEQRHVPVYSPAFLYGMIGRPRSRNESLLSGHSANALSRAALRTRTERPKAQAEAVQPSQSAGPQASNLGGPASELPQTLEGILASLRSSVATAAPGSETPLEKFRRTISSGTKAVPVNLHEPTGKASEVSTLHPAADAQEHLTAISDRATVESTTPRGTPPANCAASSIIPSLTPAFTTAQSGNTELSTTPTSTPPTNALQYGLGTSTTPLSTPPQQAANVECVTTQTPVAHKIISDLIPASSTPSLFTPSQGNDSEREQISALRCNLPDTPQTNFPSTPGTPTPTSRSTTHDDLATHIVINSNNDQFAVVSNSLLAHVTNSAVQVDLVDLAISTESTTPLHSAHWSATDIQEHRDCRWAVYADPSPTWNGNVWVLAAPTSDMEPVPFDIDEDERLEEIWVGGDVSDDVGGASIWCKARLLYPEEMTPGKEDTSDYMDLREDVSSLRYVDPAMHWRETSDGRPEEDIELEMGEIMTDEAAIELDDVTHHPSQMGPSLPATSCNIVLDLLNLFEAMDLCLNDEDDMIIDYASNSEDCIDIVCDDASSCLSSEDCEMQIHDAVEKGLPKDINPIHFSDIPVLDVVMDNENIEEREKMEDVEDMEDVENVADVENMENMEDMEDTENVEDVADVAHMEDIEDPNNTVLEDVSMDMDPVNVIHIAAPLTTEVPVWLNAPLSHPAITSDFQDGTMDVELCSPLKDIGECLCGSPPAPTSSLNIFETIMSSADITADLSNCRSDLGIEPFSTFVPNVAVAQETPTSAVDGAMYNTKTEAPQSIVTATTEVTFGEWQLASFGNLASSAEDTETLLTIQPPWSNDFPTSVLLSPPPPPPTRFTSPATTPMQALPAGASNCRALSTSVHAGASAENQETDPTWLPTQLGPAMPTQDQLLEWGPVELTGGSTHPINNGVEASEGVMISQGQSSLQSAVANQVVYNPPSLRTPSIGDWVWHEYRMGRPPALDDSEEALARQVSRYNDLMKDPQYIQSFFAEGGMLCQRTPGDQFPSQEEEDGFSPTFEEWFRHEERIGRIEHYIVKDNPDHMAYERKRYHALKSDPHYGWPFWAEGGVTRSTCAGYLHQLTEYVHAVISNEQWKSLTRLQQVQALEEADYLTVEDFLQDMEPIETPDSYEGGPDEELGSGSTAKPGFSFSSAALGRGGGLDSTIAEIPTIFVTPAEERGEVLPAKAPEIFYSFSSLTPSWSPSKPETVPSSISNVFTFGAPPSTISVTPTTESSTQSATTPATIALNDTSLNTPAPQITTGFMSILTAESRTGIPLVVKVVSEEEEEAVSNGCSASAPKPAPEEEAPKETPPVCLKRQRAAEDDEDGTKELEESKKPRFTSKPTAKEAPEPAAEAAPKPDVDKAPIPAEAAPSPAAEEAPKSAAEADPERAVEEASKPASEAAPEPGGKHAPKKISPAFLKRRKKLEEEEENENEIRKKPRSMEYFDEKSWVDRVILEPARLPRIDRGNRKA